MSEGLGQPLVDWFRRHERRLAIVYLVAVGLIILGFVARPIRFRVLDRLQGVVETWEGRWDERLRYGERLLAEGRTLEAIDYLERLDRVFPATDVRHGLDQRRELLLVLLARGYEVLDRRTRTIETYQRLVAFDPRNFRNHVDLARASERLLSGAFLAPEARDAYAAALTILPVHLPSLRGYIDYYLDRGEFAPIVRAYETYLDATLIQQIDIRLGEGVVSVPAHVDGRMHEYEIALPAPTRSEGQAVTIATGGFSAAIEEAVLQPAMVVGTLRAAGPTVLDLTRIERIGFELAPRGAAYRGLDETAALRVPIPDSAGTVGSLKLRLALFKPIDQALFAGVVKSYRNLLNTAGLAAAEARTVVLDSPESADRVIGRLIWFNEGVIAGRE